jgi:hypothetical protein
MSINLCSGTPNPPTESIKTLPPKVIYKENQSAKMIYNPIPLNKFVPIPSVALVVSV